MKQNLLSQSPIQIKGKISFKNIYTYITPLKGLLLLLLLLLLLNKSNAQVTGSISPSEPIVTSESSVDLAVTFSTDWEGYVLTSYQLQIYKNGNPYDVSIGDINGKSITINQKLEESGSYEYVALVSFDVFDGYGDYLLSADKTIEIFVDVTLNYVEPIPTLPSVPSNLIASNITTSECSLSWTASSGTVTGYRIYENGSLITTTTSPHIIIGNLNANTSYTYAVSAYNDVGESGKSNTVAITTLLPAPSAPSNLSVSNIKATELTLSWAKPSGPVTGYYIFQDGIKVKATTSTNININNLNQGTSYSFKVSAYNSGGESPKSAMVNVTTGTLPSAPTDFRIWYDVNVGYVLIWHGASENVTGFKIHTVSPAHDIVGTSTNSSILLDKLNLSPGMVYIFNVSAYNQYGESGRSNTDGIMLPPIPGAPTNLAVSNITATKCTLTWAESSGSVDHYNIYENGAKVRATDDTNITIENLDPGTNHVFTVRAYNASGESELSNAITVNTLGVSAPTNLTATNITSIGCSLVWTAANGADGYYIYQDGVKIKATTSTSANIENLSGNSAYTFTVSAYIGSNESELSNTVLVNTSVLVEPSAPIGLIAENISSNSCTLNWTAPPSIVTGYHIYQNGIKMKTVNTTEAFVGSLNPETAYSFQVSAYNDTGESPLSQSKVVNTLPISIPLAPSNFRITRKGSDYCTLSWDAPLGVVSGYYFYLMHGSTIIAKINTSSTTYTISGVGSFVSFAVSAYNNVGESPKSSIIPFQNFNSNFAFSGEANSSIIIKERNDKQLVLGQRIVIYPNPATNQLFIEGIRNFDVTIFDLNGKKISQIGKKNGIVDISQLNSGTYIIQIKTKEKTIIRRIVKQ